MSKIDAEYFEAVIIQKCLTDDVYLASVVDHLTPSHFKNADFALIVSVIVDFYNQRTVIPTITEIRARLTDVKGKNALKNTLELVKKVDKSLNQTELYENTETFIKEQAVYSTLKKVVDDIGKGKLDTADIYNQFQKACSISLSHDLGLDLNKGVDKVIADLQTKTPHISTGWKWMDNLLGGGLQQNGRAIYVFAGETNVGKSIVLGNIATNIVKAGKSVLVISLEMSEMMYARRLCSNLTGLAINTLSTNTDLLKTKVTEFYTANSSARLFIKEFPPSTITTNHLRAFIKKALGKGVKFDAIVVDYVNLITTTMGDNSYERVKYVTEQLRALTYEFNCPIVSATQLGRQGYNTVDPKLDTISESIGLAATADVIVSIWQDDTDRELGVLKMGFMKNRFGPKTGTNNFKIDYKNLTISEDSRVSNTEASDSTSDTLVKLTR